MNAEIATEADKQAALAKLAELKRVEPGSADEETMLDLVSALANYVAERRQEEVAQS